jgi:cytosine/adenosine deaminase-related metal-dependent hydrolase
MPTYTFLANFVDFGALVGAPAPLADVFRGEMEGSDAMLAALHADGIRFVTGSEAGFSLTPFGHWHARELELLVTRLGITPLEAIASATSVGGEVIMRRPGAIGVVGHGAEADLLVIDGDPLDDITILQDRHRLHHVFSRGQEVDLRRPWPVRTVYARERVGRLSREILTRERALDPEGVGVAVEEATKLDASVTSCPCML